MSERQIQPIPPTRERDISMARPPRSRGLISQVSIVLLQPRYFFRSMPLADNRQWFIIAFLILALVGWSAVRQDSLQGTTDLSVAFTTDTSLSGNTQGGGFDLGGIPSGDLTNSPIPSLDGSHDITDTLITALIAASQILTGWLVLAILLSEVSFFNSTMPKLGLNIRIAVWATVPMGVMAGIQLIYFAAGGKPGAAGISGLLGLWQDYANFPVMTRRLLLSISSQITLFWVWSLFLLYIGARSSLRGKWWTSLIVVVAWVVILVVFPVFTDMISMPEQTVSMGTDSQIVPTLQQLSPVSTEAISP